MNHVTVCMKKEAVLKCGNYERLLLIEDYYLWIKMIVANCKLENLNESLVYVRVGNDFNKKRSSKIRIEGWKILQDFMFAHGVVTRIEAMINMLCIYGFVYCPQWMKKIMYNKVLRKKDEKIC